MKWSKDNLEKSKTVFGSSHFFGYSEGQGIIFIRDAFFFFPDAMETPDSASLFVEELHKRWFDNVKEYLDKKRERVDNSEKAQKKMKC